MCAVEANFDLCPHIQTQDMKAHPHVLSPEKGFPSPRKQKGDEKQQVHNSHNYFQITGQPRQLVVYIITCHVRQKISNVTPII